MAATVRCAFSQASSSVGAMMGLNATWIRGGSLRPSAAEAARTASICSAVFSSGAAARSLLGLLAGTAAAGGAGGVPANGLPSAG